MLVALTARCNGPVEDVNAGRASGYTFNLWRANSRQNQALMRFTSEVLAALLQKLARDPRYLGARLGCLAVLHTWTRAMLYHPHTHLLVTAGGLSADGTQWSSPKTRRFWFQLKLCH